jgi:hypothetical protein
VSVAKGYLGAGEFELYRMVKWHPAETAPRDTDLLLALYWDGPLVLVAHHFADGSWCEGGVGGLQLKAEAILGWMPLPEPPKEKVR